MPVKGAVWRALEIEGFCFLINKHSKSSKKKKKKAAILAFHSPSFSLSWKTSSLSQEKVSADQSVYDRKLVLPSTVLHSKPSARSHLYDWNVTICLCYCYLLSNRLGMLFVYICLLSWCCFPVYPFTLVKRVRNALYYLFTCLVKVETLSYG